MSEFQPWRCWRVNYWAPFGNRKIFLSYKKRNCFRFWPEEQHEYTRVLVLPAMEMLTLQTRCVSTCSWQELKPLSRPNQSSLYDMLPFCSTNCASRPSPTAQLSKATIRDGPLEFGLCGSKKNYLYPMVRSKHERGGVDSRYHGK